ncbi:MAG: transcriptional regulator [Halochromatium sp.]|nr:transcriptional regulator [Halochromatium sp.]
MNIDPSAFYGALAHPTRLRTLMLLGHYSELCVCELTYAIGVSQPHLSRHLAQLREQGLVTDRRASTWVYYRINRALPAWAKVVLSETQSGLQSTQPFVDDTTALNRMPNRPDAPRCA